MKRIFKNFLKQQSTFIICFILLLSFIFMANGYSLIKTRLNLTGNTFIVSNGDEKEEWQPKVSFKLTMQMGNLFFYDIIINNDSEQTYQEWQVKIYDIDYIFYPYSIDGQRQDDGWIITNSDWDSRLEPGEDVSVTVIFQVSDDLQSSMTMEEYAKYFVENFIKVSGNSQTEDNKDGKEITNGKASLILKQNEEEITDYKIEEDFSYSLNNPNERQYIITINNNSDKNYFNIRANIYLGSGNRLLEVSPSEITCNHGTNATFKLPSWIQVGANQNVTFYIIVRTKNSDFVPSMVIAAEVL